MLPVAMLCGVLFHDTIDNVQFLAPYLIFTMLLITFCKVRPSEFRVTSLSWSLLAVQVFGSIAVYAVLRPINQDLAQGTFICVLCPTATAAPVITGMLGGSIPRLATFSIVSNITVALLTPAMFAMIGGGSATHPSFLTAFYTIAANVGPLILLPMLMAFALMYATPKVHRAIATRQAVSFYLWAVSLIIVVGRAVSFVLSEPADRIPEMLAIAVAAGVVCVAQFIIGRKIGKHCGDKIAGAQGLGQKNTVLAIWMALTYLNPIASVGPAAYVGWQNIINSAQLYIKARRERHSLEQSGTTDVKTKCI